MKAKLLYISFSFLLSVFLSDCSKKNMVNNSNEMNKKYSLMLESDYPVSVKSKEATLTASSNNEVLYTEIKKENSILNNNLKEVKEGGRSGKEINYKRLEKLYNNKLLNKIITKRVENAYKKQSTEASGLNSNVKTGIIVGAVGLVLLIISSAFAGAAFNVILLLGAVLFIIGVVLILLGVL